MSALFYVIIKSDIILHKVGTYVLALLPCFLLMKIQNTIQKVLFIIYNIVKGGIHMESIRKQTNDFRNEHEVFNFKNILENIEQSIEKFGIKVLYSDMSTFDSPDAISGYSRINEIGTPEIVVNAHHSKERRRFTMAHELGHIVLHWKWPNYTANAKYSILYRNDLSEEADSEREKEANEFAAQLLAPLDIIKRVLPHDIKDYSDYDINILSVKMAKAFKISKQFAWRQLKKLKEVEEVS